MNKIYFYIFFLPLCLLPLGSFYYYQEFFLPVFIFSLTSQLFLINVFEHKVIERTTALVKRKFELYASAQEKLDLENQIKEIKGVHDAEMEKKIQEMKEAYFAFEETKKEKEKAFSEILAIKKEFNEKLKQNDSLFVEYQQIMSEQRQIIDKHKHYIFHLENKVESQNFEIRSLLQIDTPIAPDKSLPISKKIEELNHLKSSPSFYDLSLEAKNYVSLAENFEGSHINHNLRHLFENFDRESRHIILIYSPEGKKILFVNNYVKTALGLSPDKFIKHSAHLLSPFNSNKEEKLHLSLPTKSKHTKTFQAILTPIRRGPLHNHLLALLTPLLPK